MAFITLNIEKLKSNFEYLNKLFKERKYTVVGSF